MPRGSRKLHDEFLFRSVPVEYPWPPAQAVGWAEQRPRRV